jgi:hypothetical protein
MDLAARGPSAAVRVALLVAAVFLVTGALACSNDDSPAGPTATLNTEPDTDRTTTTTTTIVEDVEAEVRAAVAKATRSYYEALADPDPADPRLKIHRADPSLEAVQAYARQLADKGQAASYRKAGLPTVSVESATVDRSGTHATAETCTLDRADLIDVETKKVLDGSTSRVRQRHRLRSIDGEWLVVEVEEIEKTEGDSECD